MRLMRVAAWAGNRSPKAMVILFDLADVQVGVVPFLLVKVLHIVLLRSNLRLSDRPG